MILPDVNVLVYAFREGAENHREYTDWLTDLLSGADELALVDAVLAGFVRIVTHPRISQPPASTSLALDFVADLRKARRAVWLPPTTAVWEQFAELSRRDRAIGGNLVPDAYLAATAIVHGAEIATADRGFARFPGLRWFDPMAG
ncbi:PIN domain-containing protein [Aldersonia sp. NBC_00410]|uniref:TA system VapC family ribonuclease toxin n=1 Tax=Aldersonia sp. NBC_00410 TaxID=2975954 RepID=UPI002259F86C|nr:TA system VapC family ribonuclease toxin [Aldersonia sp. NBC_00410]MCX5042174.1 PIN domain-containing protein [Aldersonia sp. NBC_00410]